MESEVVFDYGQLAAAVANMDVGTIILGANIELLSGITIPANKQYMIFDGEYMGVIHEFIDMISIIYSDTLHIDEASTISITFRNMIMTGRNYYGIPCIFESVNTSGVSVIYENITYTGVQLVHNPLGLTRFINCNITILPPNSHEAGEVCRVEFEGESTINHNSTDTTKAVFWFRGDGEDAYFKMMPNSKLTVSTGNYFMNTLDFESISVRYQISENASFTVNSHKGFSHALSHQISTFLVDTGASFRYIQEADNSFYASLYVNESFIVNEGASVYMQANYAGADPLIYFPSGTDYELRVNNPKSFVLYNSTGLPVEVIIAMARNYSITAEQLNRWTTARAFPEAGTFIDIPQYYWHNSDWNPFSMYGIVRYGSTSVNSSELIDPPTPISNFGFQNTRVISAGNLLIEPDPIIDNGRPITGLTEPGAKLIISFNIGGIPYTFENITADTDGRFELDPDMQLPIDTVVNIKANTPFLIKDINTTVLPVGEVTIVSAPERIKFNVPPVSTNPVLLRRINPTEAVEIYDSRPYPTRWQLSVLIAEPLKTADGEILEDAMVFRDENETLWDLNDTPFIVYTGGPATGPSSVYWPVDEGILVRVIQSIRSCVEYTTQLKWMLEAIEEP